MKKIALLFMVFFTSITAYAFNVRVFFNNKTPEAFRPVAVINYKKNNIPSGDVYIEPETPIIAPYAQHVKIDKDRFGITHYFMVWFELNDEQNHYKQVCLDSYIDTNRDSDIYFTLFPDDEDPSIYRCHHKIVPRYSS